MASLINEVSLGGRSGMTIKGNWLSTFDSMVRTMPDLSKKALNTAGFIIKESIKESLGAKMPAATRPFKVPATTKGGYQITRDDKLVDAVYQTSADESHVTVFIGSREPNSPLFIARIYNKGSVDRYVKTNKGQKLQTKKYVGKVGGLNYWDPGVQEGEATAYQAIQNILGNFLEKEIIE